MKDLNSWLKLWWAHKWYSLFQLILKLLDVLLSKFSFLCFSLHNSFLLFLWVSLFKLIEFFWVSFLVMHISFIMNVKFGFQNSFKEYSIQFWKIASFYDTSKHKLNIFGFYWVYSIIEVCWLFISIWCYFSDSIILDCKKSTNKVALSQLEENWSF